MVPRIPCPTYWQDFGKLSPVFLTVVFSILPLYKEKLFVYNNSGLLGQLHCNRIIARFLSHCNCGFG